MTLAPRATTLVEEEVVTRPSRQRIIDMAPGASDRPIVIYAAIAANFGIAVTKFIVAAISSSSSILSEAFHSTIDRLEGAIRREHPEVTRVFIEAEPLKDLDVASGETNN